MTDAIFKSFKALVPNEITAARFVSSTIAEPDATRVMQDGDVGEKLWVTGATYPQNRSVILASTHRVYRDAVGGVSNVSPDLDPTRWVNEGPTNKWAWADGEGGTRTVSPSPLVIEVAPGSVTHIGLAGMVDVASVLVEIWDAPGGTRIHNQSYSTSDVSTTNPLWDLYFTAPTYGTLRIISGLPVAPAGRIRVTLTGYKPTLAVGLIAFGRTQTLGAVEVQASAVYRDYGYSTTNKWGNTVRTKGAKGKDLRCTAAFPMSEANNVDRALLSLLDVGAIYIPSEQRALRFLTTWGLIKPAEISAPSNQMASANFEIEGLI